MLYSTAGKQLDTWNRDTLLPEMLQFTIDSPEGVLLLNHNNYLTKMCFLAKIDLVGGKKVFTIVGKSPNPILPLAYLPAVYR